MSNLLDYILWRGDLPLDVVPVNAVDGLILAQFSMMRWENAITEEDSATIAELFPAMNRQPVSVGFTAENDIKMLTAAAASARFGSLVVSDFVSHSDEALEIQFAAMALHLPDGTIYAAFRGTDSTILGWKEDFNLAFSTPVPAQEAARAYLTRLGEKYPVHFRVGGHSKGGNLAMYAASTVEDALRERILGVYNYDGPGLSDRMDAQSLYARLKGRLHSTVPQGSIVGLLLAHPDNYAVVKSTSVSILQHDPYTWQVEGPAFVSLPELSRDSARFDIAFRQWLKNVDESDREVLVQTLFNILSATGSQSFGREFWQGLARNPGAMMAAIRDVNPAHRKRVTKMMGELASAMLRPQTPEALTE